MSSPHRFVVRRQVYTPPDAAGVRRVLPEKHERVATFAKSEQAFADFAKRLAEFRRTTNPFQLGGPCLFYQTNLPAFAFHDYLLDHNITPPPTSLTANPNYVFWWVKNNRTFTDRDREVVWTACDKLKPFDVIEEDDRKSVFVVVEVPWYQNDGCQSSSEGGFPISAHMRIRDARKSKDALAAKRRRTIAEIDFWLPRGQRSYEASADEVEFAEVIQVPITGVPDDLARLVVRQSFGTPAGGYECFADHEDFNIGARIPLAATTRGEEALADQFRRTSMARQSVNPFALVGRDFLGGSWVLHPYAEAEGARLPNDLSEFEALDIVRKLPTIPPAPEVLSAEWYDRVVQWSPEFIDVIWSTFADFRLFEVIEVPLG